MNARIISVAVLAVSAACSRSVAPSNLSGRWYDWRLSDEVLTLNADGTGNWNEGVLKDKGSLKFSWKYDARNRLVTITRSSGAKIVMHYNESRGTLIQDDGGLNADRVRRGESPYADPVLVRDPRQSPAYPAKQKGTG